jgi:hypothetical protein
LYRGDTFSFQVAMWSDADKTVPVDLTGASARAEINQAGTVMLFVVTIDLPNLINVVLPAGDWVLQTGAARWDLQLTYASGDVNTLVAGAVTIVGDVVQ